MATTKKTETGTTGTKKTSVASSATKKTGSTTSGTSKTSSTKSTATKSTSTKSSAAKSSSTKSTSTKSASTRSTAASDPTIVAGSSINASSGAKAGSGTRKSSGSKKKKSGAKKGGITLLGVLVLILFGVWYVYGKPTLEFAADGVYIVQTEVPSIMDILLGKDDVEPSYGDINGVEQEEITTPVSRPAGTASSSGTKGSSNADLGYSENDPLYFGNPTDALADTKSNENYLMVKKQYTLSYNTNTLCPNWVAWHLDTSDFGKADRSNDFRPDEELPNTWYWVKKADYMYNDYGFDRGHVCPSADRTATQEDNSMTFLMTNMVPQTPDNNRVIWMHFENYERELVSGGKEAYIIAGPYGTGGTSGKGTFDSIPVKTKSGEILHMNVPATTWKVLILLDEGTNDLSRVNANTTVVAINVPNQMGMGKTGDWEQYLTTIDEIEALTGYDFFELLPDDVEDIIESKVYEYKK